MVSIPYERSVLLSRGNARDGRGSHNSHLRNRRRPADSPIDTEAMRQITQKSADDMKHKLTRQGVKFVSLEELEL